MLPGFTCERNNFIIDIECYVVGDKSISAYRMERVQNGDDKTKQVMLLHGGDMASFVVDMRSPKWNQTG
jgi:hypothetical protein